MDKDEIVRWLVDGARTVAAPEDVMAELCGRLEASGVPLWRSSVFVRTLHPNLMGRRFTWLPDRPVEVSAAPYRMLESDEFRLSPVVRVYDTAASLRRRLADPDCPLDFAVLHGFAAEGVTDYLATPLIFSNGDIHVATWTTRAAGGFEPLHVAALEAVSPPLARIAEIYALRRVARTLLDTYVGPQAGARILGGHIRRGESLSIEAAIWLSDMRGFTALADRLPPETLVAILNRYFDAQAPAIARHGGEVLKFIGDGLLAIFPVADGDRAAACQAALRAAREARDAIAALDAGSGGGDADAGLLTTYERKGEGPGAAAGGTSPNSATLPGPPTPGAGRGAGPGGNIASPGGGGNGPSPAGGADAGAVRVRFGLALHVGAVLYGNIGSDGASGARLDFTCIGPAVNLAARLEKLAGELGRTLLASSEFAALAPGLEPVGRFTVRGIGAAQRVFGLAEEAERGD